MIKTEIKILLVGLGPHAKRVYMKCFDEYGITPTLIVDLECKKTEIENYLSDRNMNVPVFGIDDKYRDCEELPADVYHELYVLVKKMAISHCIISTEPKAHKAYLLFCLKNHIHILVDKPLTAPKNVINDINKAKQILEDYNVISDLYRKATEQGPLTFQLQCQRRWHNGYKLAHKIVTEMIKKYNIPITSMHITHCDGMWNMPDEFVLRENHPYKYGYGKLFHSGYHFVDLLAWFASANNLIAEKKTDYVEMYASAVTTNDFMHIVNKNDYHNLLQTNKFDNIFNHYDEYHFENYGEVDFNSILTFKNQGKNVMTATMNLLQDGFSRRSWSTLPEDTYKANGRVRHEYVNIEIGPLMNIQIHSYQSKEISDRVVGQYTIGEVEHFNVYIFRNVGLIGGKPMEKYTLQELYDNEEILLGFNETARVKAFDEFINCNCDPNAIYDHKLGMMILSKGYEALCHKQSGQFTCIGFDL